MPLKSWIDTISSSTKVVVSALVGFGAVAGVLLFAYNLIDQRIDAKLADPALVRRIAAEVRPALIFDSDNRILVDQGALQYVESLHFEFLEGGDTTAKLVVTPKSFLAVAPLLESLDVEGYDIKVDRGPGVSWVYTLTAVRFFESAVKIERFRLEILR
jgi:hypothetical protein